MLPPDMQRLAHIRDYCLEIGQTIARYGNSFDIFEQDIPELLAFIEVRAHRKTNN